MVEKFFTTGVFYGDLMVSSNNNMTITLDGGYVNVEGKVRIFDVPQTLIVETADATYNRIDTVVIERNDTDRNITAKVVKGGYSSEPTPIAPIRTNGIYQLVVAEIFVPAGATKILQSNITDKRTDTSVCGLVVCPIDDFDFDQFAVQFNAYLAEFKADQADSFATWSAQQKADFEAWELTIRNILDQGAAGHLQNEIDDIYSKLTDMGGSIIKVQFPSAYTGKTAVLTTSENAYSVVVGLDGLAKFSSVKEIGLLVCECEDASGSITIPYYGVYSFNTNSFGYEGWLASANITKPFSSLADVLADETVVRELMTKHASADYLLDWSENDNAIVDTFVANANAMKWIGLRDYICDKLLAIPTWKSAMLES
ncbi:MAG: hypothetical protein Q4A15_00405, partial [Prevotellaceae bacterium]|nr:hypothetical protein [Prevotellaceae bacterium]